MNLRQTAKEAPHCFSCFKPNPNGDLLCLAHSNALAHGRGAYHKTPDVMGAIVCSDCHDLIDGRKGALTLSQKREMHRVAHERSLLWWWNNNYLRVAS